MIGGGDSAMEDSIFISKFADKLTIVHRRDEFRASKIMEDRARGKDNIEVMTPYVAEEFVAGDDGKIDHVRLAQRRDRRDEGAQGRRRLRRDRPHAALRAGRGPGRRRREGYVIVDEPSTKTKLAGVFAVGDLVDHTYRQAVTAAGTGTKGALDAEWYLRDTPPSPEAHWAGRPARSPRRSRPSFLASAG